MALTTFMTSWQDFDKVTLVQLPMFLFSATFFPVDSYPTWVRWIVECTPLYRGVVLCRELTTGALSWGCRRLGRLPRRDGRARAGRRTPSPGQAPFDIVLG